jgi:hypothetical protein
VALQAFSKDGRGPDYFRLTVVFQLPNGRSKGRLFISGFRFCRDVARPNCKTSVYLKIAGNLEMTHHEEVSFEIFDGGDLIRLEPLHVISYSSNLDWDKNWIKTKVTVKSGAFSGQYFADFMTTDYELLKRALRKLNNDFNGQAKFEPLEGELVLQIRGDGLGHFEVHCTACDQPGLGGKLAFGLSFDQTELSRLIKELVAITKLFPIIGDMKIKNE